MLGTTRLGPAVVVVGLLGAMAGATGGAHAAGLITGQQIKDGSVTSRDVRNGSVIGFDVRDFSLTPDDFDGEVIGPQGPRGEQGVTGAPALGALYYALAPVDALSPGETGTSIAVCDPGLVALGGGTFASMGARLQLLDSSPLGPQPEARGAWAARARNNTNAKVDMLTWAVCAEVQP